MPLCFSTSDSTLAPQIALRLLRLPRFFYVCGNLFRRKHQEIRNESQRGLLIVEIFCYVWRYRGSPIDSKIRYFVPPVSCLSLKRWASLQVWCNSGYPRARPIHIWYGTVEMPTCCEVVPLKVPVNSTAAFLTCSLGHNFVNMSVLVGKCCW